MFIKFPEIVARLLPVFAALSLVMLTLGLWQTLVRTKEREVSKLEGGSVRNEIQSQMTARVKALERMAKRWSNNDAPDRQRWEFEAALNVADFGGYQAINFIDDSMRVRWVVPSSAGNEAVEDFDSSSDAVRTRAIDEARARRATVVTSQVSLIQGGRGFLAIVPVYVGEKYEGCILGAFRSGEFFDTILDEQIAPGFAVSVFDGAEEIYRRFSNDNQKYARLAQQSEFSLGGKQWKILVEPTDAVFESESSSADDLVLIAGLILALLLGLTIFQLQESHRKKELLGAAKEKLERAGEKLEDEAEIRRRIETQLRSLLDAMTETIMVLDRDAYGYIYRVGVVEATDAAAFKNQDLRNSLDAETADKLIKSIGKTLETRQPSYIEYVVTPPDGYRQMFSSIISPMSANLVVLVGRDITKQKTVEAKLRESEANYRDLFDNATDLIQSVGADGKFLYVNRAWLAALGYRQEDLEALTLGGVIHPEESDYYAEITRQIGEGKTIETIETRFITKSGETRRVEGNIHAHYESGKGLSARGIFRDITERRETETALERLRFRYETILNEAGEGILEIDFESRITFANPRAAEMLGCPIEAMLGEFQYELVYASEVDCAKCEWEKSRIYKTLREGVSQEVADERFTRRDKTSFSVEYTSTPIRENGATVGAVIIFKDATERVRLAESQRQATESALELTRAKSQFVARVSHELRTPISGIIGMAGLLLNTPLAERQLEYGQIIAKSANSLLMLINDLLDFSKIEAHKLEIFDEPFVLEEVIQNCLDTSAVQAAAKNLDVVAVNEIRLLRMISGDAFRLQQILNNLIGNAVKFTERGEVVVSVMQDYETPEKVALRFTVADTGVGIDAKTGAELFKPFAQGAAQINLRSGTGLGLHICRQLVELLGGEIGFDSEPGRGTTFWFTAVFNKRGEDRFAPKIFGALAGRRILISLENPRVALRVALQTTFWNMNAVVAESRDHAVELLRDASGANGNFDLMLVEDVSALAGGSDFLSRVSYEAAHLPVKIILLVPLAREVLAHSDSFDRIAHAHLTKPLSYWSLFQIINHVLQKGEVRRRIASAPLTIETSAPEKSAPAEKSLSVLIAEDNEVNQKVIRYQLEEMGHEVTLVGDGRQAVECAAVFRYDLLLMDCHMPLMDGFAAAREIRRQEAEDGAEKNLIYALTATVNESIKEECLAAGMNGYFSKPFDVKTLSGLLAGIAAPGAASTENDRLIADKPADDVPLPNGAADFVLKEFIEQNKDRSPKLVAEIVEIFLRDVPSRLAQLKEAIKTFDFERVERDAHRLRGTALNMGFDKIAEICQKLESLKSAADAEIESALPSAAVYFAELENETAVVARALREKYGGEQSLEEAFYAAMPDDAVREIEAAPVERR